MLVGVSMVLADLMKELEALGTEQTKRTIMNHGAKEPYFGVKIGDLKKLVKHVKKDQELALSLYDTGNSDAMYLAGLSVNPKLMTKEKLQEWVEKAYWYMLAEYTVAGVAAESNYALELAREWIRSESEFIATAGWSTYGNYISITPDAQLDLDEIRRLLTQVEETVHAEKNRVRYTMNGFVIGVGVYVEALHEEALRVANKIGKVHVNVGQTACKVPIADDYINKTKAIGKAFAKRKTCIC